MLILVDHTLSYALTATANFLTIYIQQFWRAVKQVSNANETIHFMVDKQEIRYIVYIFRGTLKLPIETHEQPFIPPVDFDYIRPFLRILGFQGSLERIPNDLLIDAIKDTQVYRDYVEMYIRVVVPVIPPESVESIQGMHRTPKATRTPNLDIVQKKRKGKYIVGESSSPKPSLKKRIRQKKSTSTTHLPPKILEEDVENLVEEEDESDGDEFADTMLLSDEDFGNSEIRTEKMQTPIP
ncbi:hypothetical protein Tco_0938316 [Tanacetum coccineum]|uniref:Uncharacterized protein n=1 Tax=Tanacetum coccineum TaxID=301880 RepID=A0ABQ5DGS5_9ASTR